MLDFCHLLTSIKIKKKKSPSYTIRVSNSLDLNQDLHNVGPHLGPNDFNIVNTFQIHKKLSCFPQLIWSSVSSWPITNLTWVRCGTWLYGFLIFATLLTQGVGSRGFTRHKNGFKCEKRFTSRYVLYYYTCILSCVVSKHGAEDGEKWIVFDTF